MFRFIEELWFLCKLRCGVFLLLLVEMHLVRLLPLLHTECQYAHSKKKLRRNLIALELLATERD